MKLPIFIDTETTGLDPKSSRVVEIALIDHTGKTLLDTLIDPQQPIPAEASAIHGIFDDNVAGAPRLVEVMPLVCALARGKEVVIYNAHYDTQFLPWLRDFADTVRCAMLAAQSAMGLSRWPKLVDAAQWAGHTWEGEAHRALADTRACRAVWAKIQAHRGFEVRL